MSHNDSNLSALLQDTEQMEAGIVESQSTSQMKETIQLLLNKMNEIVTVNNKMLEKIQSLQEENDKIQVELYDQKVELTELNQYGRRENIELCGIPESVKDNDLETHVLEVATSMGVKVQANGIHALHRIGKQSNSRPRNVIVRFVNRKSAFSMLKNKRKLNSGKFKRYFIIENLCPYNKRIFNRLYRLKKNKDIHSLWTYNGNIFVKVRENDERQQVFHLNDIDNLWGESEAGSDDSRLHHVASVSADDSDGDNSSPAVTPVTNSEAPGDSQNSSTSLSSRKPPVPPKPSLSSTHLSVVEEENSFVSTPIEPITINV